MNLARLDGIYAGADCFIKRDPSGQQTITEDVRGKSIADHYQDAGLTLEQAKIDRIQGAGAVLQLLGDESVGVEPRLHVFSTCTELIGSVPALVHDPKRAEDVLKVDVDENGEGGDDLYDALRYGVMDAFELGGWSTSLKFLQELAS